MASSWGLWSQTFFSAPGRAEKIGEFFLQLLNSSWSAKNLSAQVWDFPGGLVAKNSGSQCSRPGLIPDPGVSSHVSQLRIWMLQLRILCATTLDLAQPNKNNLFLKGLGLRKNRSKPVFSPSSSSCPVRCRSLDPGWLFTLNILMN